jgi:hypothetical protein
MHRPPKPVVKGRLLAVLGNVGEVAGGFDGGGGAWFWATTADGVGLRAGAAAALCSGGAVTGGFGAGAADWIVVAGGAGVVFEATKRSALG